MSKINKIYKKCLKAYRIGAVIGRLSKYRLNMPVNEINSLMFYTEKLNDLGYKTNSVIRFFGDKGIEYGEKYFVLKHEKSCIGVR